MSGSWGIQMRDEIVEARRGVISGRWGGGVLIVGRKALRATVGTQLSPVPCRVHCCDCLDHLNPYRNFANMEHRAIER